MIKQEITIPYYKDNSRISNSNIGQYIRHGPKYLRDYLDGKEEGLSASFLEKGTMIHMYLLQPDEFWQEYKIIDYEIPKSKQAKAFCEDYANSLEIEPDQQLIKAYRNNYKCENTTDDKVLTLAQTMAHTCAGYIDYLTSGKTDNKKVISFADLAMLKKIKSNIENHKKANELLYNLSPNWEEQNEFHINWTYPKHFEDLQIECKSLLDRFLINHHELKITLVDIKTTAHIGDFQKSMKEFDYYRQCAYYWMAIHWYFKNVLELDISNYTYETNIIAISTSGDYRVRVFKIDPSSIEDRIDIINETIANIAWHKKNNLWDHTREYYIGDGAEFMT